MKTTSSTPQTERPADPASIASAVLVSIALNVEGRIAPEWIELIPAGVEVQGRDGRRWVNDQPEAVVRATATPIPLDWEHATHIRAPEGLEAPAAAWIEEVEVRDGGSVWGRVAWTPRGNDQVVGREYRFVSPGFDFERSTGRITRLVHAGLTNTPNLVLTALNRERPTDITREKETSVDLATRLRTALGLTATATDEEIIGAVNQARAVNRPVDLTAYAPRAELETAVNRANAVTAERDALLKEKTDAAVETAINGALDAGKIIPASADTYRAMCREEGGLERFNALVATLPVIAGAAESRAVNRVETATGKSKLTEEERAVCRVLNLSEDAFLAQKEA